jgi:hypothetical protein
MTSPSRWSRRSFSVALRTRRQIALPFNVGAGGQIIDPHGCPSAAWCQAGKQSSERAGGANMTC